MDDLRSIAEKLGLPQRGTPIDKRLEILNEIVASIKNVTGLNNHPGWVSILGPYQAELKSLEDRIHQLAQNPVKNDREIMWLEALRTAQKRVLDIFSRNLIHYETIETEYVKLKREADQLGQRGDS